MKFEFSQAPISALYNDVPLEKWTDWLWQVQNMATEVKDFSEALGLTTLETQGFKMSENIFKVGATPYYLGLSKHNDSIKKILLPRIEESHTDGQHLPDPLGEDHHSVNPRLIHRYSDRVLFLVTDNCSVYCRFCTRKRFTGGSQGYLKSKEYAESLNYIRSHTGIREVILSGGDPLVLSNNRLAQILNDIRTIEHVEIIRIGSRMPVVCPMRIDSELVQIFKKTGPVFIMTHFSHPKELTLEAKTSLDLLVDNGIPVFNQMVLLNGVNNHVNIIQALNRRLLYLRVKPYYMFQCDPSEGTDHLRTPIEDGEEIVREMWGHLSGLAMPTFALDIPNGGGKVSLAPDFMIEKSDIGREFIGWDNRKGIYLNPKTEQVMPSDYKDYQEEWTALKSAKKLFSPT